MKNNQKLTSMLVCAVILAVAAASLFTPIEPTAAAGGPAMIYTTTRTVGFASTTYTVVTEACSGPAGSTVTAFTTTTASSTGLVAFVMTTTTVAQCESLTMWTINPPTISASNTSTSQTTGRTPFSGSSSIEGAASPGTQGDLDSVLILVVVTLSASAIIIAIRKRTKKQKT